LFALFALLAFLHSCIPLYVSKKEARRWLTNIISNLRASALLRLLTVSVPLTDHLVIV
jgi:hypothetical protein